MSRIDATSRRFILLTYLFTWLLWLPALVQSARGEPLSSLVIGIGIPGMMVPSVMGLIFLTREQPFKSALRQLFQVKWNRWLVISILALPLVVTITHLVHVRFFDGNLPTIEQPETIPLRFLSILIAGGPLFEEIGWRGYLQKRLLTAYPTLVAGILMGLIWGIWHIPLFLIKGMFHEHIPLDQFSITVVLMSILMCWILPKAQSGIWPALILHTFMNLTQELTPLFDSSGHLPWSITNAILLLIVLGIFLYRAKSPENHRFQSS